MRILIDLDEQTVSSAQTQADARKWDRKIYLQEIIIDFVRTESARVKELKKQKK